MSLNLGGIEADCSGLKHKVVIVAVVYKEPEYQETKACIETCNVPTVYIERDPPGVGSLARVINAGFKIAKDHYNPEFVWFVTNITFFSSMLGDLLYQMEVTKYAAIHPCFDSDHTHLRQKVMPVGVAPTLTVPFVEFTAPMVRASVFEKFPLDELMPYVGHDMAWSYEVRKAGFEVGCFHDEKIGHVYIRHKKMKNLYTFRRRQARQKAVQPTIKRLIELYGPDYKKLIQYHGAL